MSAIQSRIKAEEVPSLDKTLHNIRDDLAAARVAAMQVLVFQMQAASSDTDVIKPDEFMAAVADVSRAHNALRDLNVKRLDMLGIDLPDDLATMVKTVCGDLAELMRILERCSKNDSDGIRGFKAASNFYDLCCTRVAKGLNDVSSGLAAFFLQLSEKEKAEAVEKTNKIALEIGKIGRVINMVATNASIEAARVGDAGKGFTVIADEVKQLSARVSSLSVSLTKNE